MSKIQVTKLLLFRELDKKTLIYFLYYSQKNTNFASMKVEIFEPDFGQAASMPFSEAIKAGFPSPAEDYRATLDLNEALVRHKESTFYAKISGDSMTGIGIFDGDIAIIDRLIQPKNGDIVVAQIDGEYTLKEFQLDEKNNCAWLIPHNPKFRPIKVTAEQQLDIFVVTYTIHRRG